MGHYDNCREGYCHKCGAGPGNLQSNGGICPFCFPEPRNLDQSIRPIKYRHTPDMGEISGFGGGYEAACQDMLEAGAKWIEAKKVSASDLKISTIRGVFGVCFPQNQPAKELDNVVWAAAPDGTGAMVHAVMLRLYMIAQFGWDKYCEEMRNIQNERE